MHVNVVKRSGTMKLSAQQTKQQPFIGPKIDLSSDFYRIGLKEQRHKDLHIQQVSQLPHIVTGKRLVFFLSFFLFFFFWSGHNFTTEITFIGSLLFTFFVYSFAYVFPYFPFFTLFPPFFPLFLSFLPRISLTLRECRNLCNCSPSSRLLPSVKTRIISQKHYQLREETTFSYLVVNKCNSRQRQRYEPITLARYAGNVRNVPSPHDYFLCF
jgi:hypothetical protein